MLNYYLFDDNQLVSLLKDGDEGAFTEIYNRYWKKLYYISHKLLKDTTATEEIIQEVFLMLWKKKNSLNIQSLPAYLSAMVRYSVYHYLAKEKKYQENKSDETVLLNLADPSETNIDHKLLLEIITQLSNKLPEKCRLVFQHNKLNDQSLNEVAKMLNISQKTAEGHLTKALRIIRTNLEAITKVIVVSIAFLFNK